MRTTSWSMASVLAGVAVAVVFTLTAPGFEATPAQATALPVPTIPDLPDPRRGGQEWPPLPPPTIPQWTPGPGPSIPTWTPPVSTIPSPPPWTDTETTDPPVTTEAPSSTGGTGGAGPQRGASTLTPGPTGAPAGGTANTTQPDPRLTLTPDRGSPTTTGRPISTTDEYVTPGSAGSPPVAVIATAGLTSVAAAAGAGVVVRARRVRRWPTEHVDTQPKPAPPVVAVEPPPGQMHGHAVRLEPREDAGHQFIEENGRDQN
ncbi:hypothetical protein ABIC28_003200 [Rhodococcus sp. PvR044]|uniref:hypothetical protein n=1 Tax=unclassified Rhodococcus (in: high G+C Gram-positive bacteria) TaxID=192944 RepID=UPI00117BCA32|nr:MULTISPECIES: hypothetical protein [unclassified Rhodococcus (in: high G+C Gram-positive bacteria)]